MEDELRKTVVEVCAAAYVDRFLEESSDEYSPFMDALAAGQFEEEADRRRRAGLALLRAFAKGYRRAREAFGGSNQPLTKGGKSADPKQPGATSTSMDEDDHG